MKIFKNRKYLIIIALILVAAVAGALLIGGNAAKSSTTASEQRTAVATRGTLNVTLSGSGTVSPTLRKDITVKVEGEVEESFLEEGKVVKAGDILLKLKDNDAQLALKKLENSVKQKELELGERNVQNGALSINAPISGRVTGLSVKEGDTVNKGTVLMTVIDENSFQTRVTFENATSSQFSGINTVQLHIPDFMATVTGQIESLAQDGSNLHAVVTVDNPGALESGISAWVEAKTGSGSITSTEGILEAHHQVTVKADAMGTVSNLLAYNGQKIGKNNLLLTLSGEDLVYTLEEEQLALEQSYIELQQAREKLENTTLRAPFDGVITSVTDLSKGDGIKAGTKVGVINNDDEMTFTVNIDELDISQIQTGQNVFVTADALEDSTTSPIEGKVTAVAQEGTSNNGVTSYPVTVTIPGSEKLKSGMNVDAVIQIFSKGNALLVPIEAVQKQGNGYMVWVKGNASSDAIKMGENPPGGQRGTGGIDIDNMTDEERKAMRQKFEAQGSSGTAAQKNRQNAASNYYSGAVAVRVNIGQHNETYMEITEGLDEGDTVILPALVSNSSNSKSSTFTLPMGGGGPAGGFGGGSIPGNTGNRRGN